MDESYWRVLSIGENDPHSAGARTDLWCTEVVRNMEYVCSRHRGHEGHHVATLSYDPRVLAVMLVENTVPVSMRLPEGF